MELSTDVDVINLLKKGMRGGISQCTQRKYEANKYMPNYSPNEKSFIMYLDPTKNLIEESDTDPATLPIYILI